MLGFFISTTSLKLLFLKGTSPLLDRIEALGWEA